jgi:hypothetical protein
MPHFREFIDPNFLSNIDFLNEKGQYIKKIVTITNVSKQEIHNGKGSSEMVPTVHLKETKPLVLSKRNLKTIIAITRKINTDEWKGQRIELGIKEGVKAFGELHDVIRVTARPIPPAAPVDYSAQAAALRACATLESLQATYMSLTPEAKAATATVKDEMKQKLSKEAAQ